MSENNKAVDQELLRRFEELEREHGPIGAKKSAGYRQHTSRPYDASAVVAELRDSMCEHTGDLLAINCDNCLADALTEAHRLGDRQ